MGRCHIYSDSKEFDQHDHGSCAPTVIEGSPSEGGSDSAAGTHSGNDSARHTAGAASLHS